MTADLKAEVRRSCKANRTLPLFAKVSLQLAALQDGRRIEQGIVGCGHFAIEITSRNLSQGGILASPSLVVFPGQ